MFDRMHEEIQVHKAENVELRAELARVRGERDRAVEAATYFQCYRSQRKPLRPAALERAVGWIDPRTIVGADTAAALAEHDRRFSGPGRPAGAAPASPG